MFVVLYQICSTNHIKSTLICNNVFSRIDGFLSKGKSGTEGVLNERLASVSWCTTCNAAESDAVAFEFGE